MLLTFLLPIAIWTLPLLMLWLMYARACRNYIEQRQSSNAAGTGVASEEHTTASAKEFR